MTQRTKKHSAAIACTFEAACAELDAHNTIDYEADTILPPETSKPSIGFDAAYYQSYLDDYDIPEAQKRELINALWAIIVQLIDLGLGVHPINAVQSQQQSDETLNALQALTRDFAADAFEADPSIDPVLIEELVIADQSSTSKTVKSTISKPQTKRSET